MKSALVTGGGRGIGAGFARLLIARGWRVAIACRRPQELGDFGEASDRVRALRLDLTDVESFEEFAGRVAELTGDGGLNLLINNAGVTSKFGTLRYVRARQLEENFAVNVVGPVMLTKSLLPSLRLASRSCGSLPVGIERAAVVNLSSVLGSIGANDRGGFYAYRCSKAALNAATRSMSVDLRRDGIMAVAVHPGWVRTEMGGERAPLGVDESVAATFETLGRLGEEHSGRFFQYDGEELPW